LTKRESADFAQASDLLAPGKEETEVYLRTLKKKVKIKKINIGELSEIVKASKDDDIKQFVYIAFKGLIRPALTIEEASKLPMKVVMELSSAIAKFSELDKDSIDGIKNLLGTEP